MSKKSRTRPRNRPKLRTKPQTPKAKAALGDSKAAFQSTSPAEIAAPHAPASERSSNLHLRRWNRWLAVIFAVQAVVILLLSAPHVVAVTITYLTNDPLASTHMLVPAVRHLFQLNITYLVASFLLVPAAVHTLSASLLRDDYEADLAQKKNRLRWIEYSVSTGLLVTTAALLAGIYDAASLLMLIALVIVVPALGRRMEQRTERPGGAAPGCLGCCVWWLAGTMPWIVFAIYAFGTSVYGGAPLPAYVYWLYVSMGILFAGFAANFYLQRKRHGRWADYLYGERVYMIISLAAKTLLTWQIFGGLLHP